MAHIAKGLFAPRERRIDNVLAIARHDGKAAVGVVLQVLRVDLTNVELFRGDRQPLAVGGLLAVLLVQVDEGDLVVAGDDDLSRGVHARERVLVSQLYSDRPLVVPDRHVVGALERGDRPAALKGVVESILQPIGHRVPDLDRAVLRPGEDDGQLRVAANSCDVVSVPLHGRHALLRLVVPHLDCEVVGAGDEVGPVASLEVVDAVDALVVALEREVWLERPKAPHLDRSIQRRGREGVRILGVERHHHHIVGVALVRLRIQPPLVPIPQSDGHIIRRGEEQRLGGVDGDAPARAHGTRGADGDGVPRGQRGGKSAAVYIYIYR
jgi:hypothetical protein